MIRTRSKQIAGLRAGLFSAVYLLAALLPAGAAAANPAVDPGSPAPSAESLPTPGASPAPEASTQPSDPAGASLEPNPSSGPTLEPSPLPVALPTPSSVPEPSGVPEPGPQPSASAVPLVRYIVTFTPGASAGQRAAALSAGGTRTVSTIPALGLAIVELPAGPAAPSAGAALAADPAIKSVEQDLSRDVEAAPTDPRFADQWSLPLIGWDRLHARGLPTGSVTVAILDTGVDATQPDLQGRLLPGQSFVAGSPANTDPHGHGTWMAGIVAAATDNGVGIAGIGGAGVRVLPITVLGADGTGQDSAVIAGIVAAVNGGANVILMAFSNPGYSPALQAAVDYAWAHDVVLVAANGNDGTTNASYPAADRAVMGIASTDQADRLAADSNHGPQTFLAAPGVDILTTAAGTGDNLQTEEYRSISGTSAAAAEVAGAAAVLRALDGGASNAVIVGRLARSAAPVGSRAETGNGRLDLARAMSDLGTSAVEPSGVAGAADGGPFVGPYVAAAVRTWTGGGANNNWTTPANWGGVAPLAGDDLVFPSGALQLSNTNDFAAATSFKSITIAGSGYTLSGNSIALGIGNLAESGVGASNTISLAMSFAATDSITVSDAGATLTASAVISGAGGLTKLGAGTLILSAANAYTGVTTLSAGVIDARSNAALGTGAGATTVASGAALDVDGSGLTITKPLTLNGAGTAGAGALLNLATNNTWSGAITLGSASTIGSAAGTLTVSGATATAGFLLTVDGAGNVSKSAGAISGTGGLSQTATGTLTLGVVNTYTGATSVNAGTLKMGIANAVGAGSALTLAGGATFDLNGFSDSVGSLAGAGNVTNSGVGAATLTSGGNNTSTAFSGVASDGSGALGLTKTGSGTLTLSGTNTYTGVTALSVGVLHLQSSAALGGTAGGTTVAANAAIEIDGSGLLIPEPITSLSGTGVAGAGALRNLANDNTWSGNITLGAAGATITSDGGTFTLSGSLTGTAAKSPTVGGLGNTTISGVIAGTATLTKTGGGTLTLSGVNIYTGATTINAGTLTLGITNATGASGALMVAGGTFDLNGFSDTIGSLAGAGNVTSSAAGAVTLTTSNGTSTTFSGVAADGSGTLALTKAGAGTLTLSGINTYTGTTTIDAGVISIAADSALGTAPGSPTAGQLTFSGGTLLATATMTLDPNRGIALGAGGGTIFTNAGITLGYGGIIDGPNKLTKTGAGTLTLWGVNTYTGATALSAGVIDAQSNAALGTAAGATTVTSGAELDVDGSGLTIAEPLTLNGTGMAAAGALRNLANNTTWSGIITLGALGATVTSDGGTFTLSGSVGGNTRPLTVGGLGNTTISGVIGITTGTLTKTDSGTLTLSATNTYTGATTINAGTLSIAADRALGAVPGAPTAGKLSFGGGALQTTASLTLNSNRGIALGAGGGTFDVAAGTTLVYGGSATGTGGLTKMSAGALDLSGATATVGGVTISAGTLVAPNAGSFAVAGDWTNNASAGAFTAGTGTVTLSGTSPQSVGGSFKTTFNGLTIANASGITLGADTNVTGILTLTTGTVTTGVHTIYLASGATVSRTTGYVVGNFEKHFATGAPSQAFEVGDASTYAPVTVAFASVSAAGDLTVSTTAGDHPAIGSSTLDPAETANRFWTLTNSGITSTTYSATFTFVAGDLDPGLDTNHLVVEAYAGGTWTPLATGTRTSSSTQATGISSFGDFAVGQLTGSALDHFVVSAPATATAGSALDVTLTAVDAAGNTVTGYTGTITFSSTDAYAAFSPSSYTFLAGDYGTKTFTGGAVLKAAGSQTVSVSGSSKSGTSAPIAVAAGAFAKLLVLVPGEAAAPGSPTGKTGSPNVQTANGPFTVTVHAVDANWNVVSSSDTVAITSSDASALLPPNAALVAGAGSFSITLETGGSATVSATDITDGSKTAGSSGAIPVTNTAPIVAADNYTVLQGNPLVVAAPGVLSNDTDPQGQAIVVADPRPVSGPVHGVLTLNPDGSFTYTPDPGYSGTDTFTYQATDGYLSSSAATVTIAVSSSAYVSSAGWATSFSPSRYLKLSFPAYVPAGSLVTGATFRTGYRSEIAGDTTCYYFEVYAGATLLATHGSAASPVSCNATSTFEMDTVALPEIDSVAKANAVTIVLYVKNSGGNHSVHQLATLGVTYSHD